MSGHLLGVMPAPRWTPVDVPLGPGAAVLLYTDGLIEGRAAPGSASRLGVETLVELTDLLTSKGLAGAELLDALLAEAHDRNGAPMTDDVALCLVSIPPTRPAHGA
jgi:serine phosphatase RsbU (regulator of sigma subunit)